MPELQRLQARHASAVLAFELENRDWFARSIDDRGDAFFEHFEEHFAHDVAQEPLYYVLVDHDGSVVGRVNLRISEPGTAVLGYRTAERSAGQGLTTDAVRRVCHEAAADHGIQRILAAVSSQNPASQRVLEKAGFTLTGPADPSQLGGKAGSWWELPTPW